MLRSKIILFMILLGSFVTSCETDVDLFSEHGEVPVVFALLEPADSIQYFRINPTFVGEGDARTLAGDAGLTNYEKGEIEVKLIDVTQDIEYSLKDSLGLINLDPDGIFNENNRIYYLETPIDSNGNKILIAGNVFKLSIRNTKTEAITSSTIQLGDIDKLAMTFPKPDNGRLSLFKFYTGSNYDKNFVFSFRSDDLCERYLLELKYYYTTRNETFITRDNYVDMIIGEINGVPSYTAGIKDVSIEFDSEKFYSVLNTKLDASVKRTGEDMDIILTAVGEDLDTYVTIQDASLTGISQEKPSYSNIENGLGIFSFRLTYSIGDRFLNEASTKNIYESPYTIDRFNCAWQGVSGNFPVKRCLGQ